MRCEIVKTKTIRTILFAALLCDSKRKRTAVAAGQKSSCGLRYHGSRDSPKNSNLIEKKVSKKNVKSSKHKRFSPFFFVALLCGNKRERAPVAAGQKSVCGLWSHGSRDSHENSNLIEKKVSEKNQKLSKIERFSPFFLRCHFVLINRTGRLRRRSKNPSVGWDITDRVTAPKIAI